MLFIATNVINWVLGGGKGKGEKDNFRCTGAGTSDHTVHTTARARPLRKSMVVEDDSLVSSADIEQIERVLSDKSRRDVLFTFSLHNAVKSDDGFRLHLVLKFKYDVTTIEECFGVDRPSSSFEQRYGDPFRIFPFCLFNSIDESPISWTYQLTGERVYERCELFCTLSDVTFLRFFPFELRLVSLKVGTNGTAKTGLINLKPELLKDGKPNVDFGVFKKDTSVFRITKPENAMMQMVIRDLSESNEGNISGIYTRCYTTFLFEQRFTENVIKFIAFSMILVLTTIYLPKFELSDIVSHVLALVLMESFLYFVLPHTQGYTTTERVLIFHTLYMLCELFVLGVLVDSWSMGSLWWLICTGNIGVTIMTCCFVAFEYSEYRAMRESILRKFDSIAMGYVAFYKPIDAII